MSWCLRRKSEPRITATISTPTTTKGCSICLSLRFTNMDMWAIPRMCSPAAQTSCILLGVILRYCGNRFSTFSRSKETDDPESSIISTVPLPSFPWMVAELEWSEAAATDCTTSGAYCFWGNPLLCMDTPLSFPGQLQAMCP